MTEIGCMAHARREFVELHAINKSMIATFSFQLYSSSPGYTAHESSLAAYDGLQPGHHGLCPSRVEQVFRFFQELRKMKKKSSGIRSIYNPMVVAEIKG
ncbi:hypothetical protein D3C80_1801040 [compost metagenome]